MSNKRKKWTKEEKQILFRQIDGLCPLCHKQIKSDINPNVVYIAEIAHIFPLNSSKKEDEEYGDLPRLSDDVNSLNNVVMMCPNCHKEFDKKPTRDSYLKLYNIKKKMIEKDRLRGFYSDFSIEKEITVIIDYLTQHADEVDEKLIYEAYKVDEKLGMDFKPIIKMRIKDDICKYYSFIKERFKLQDASKPRSFEIIAAQMKAFSIKMEMEASSKEVAFEHLCTWLSKMTDTNETACEAVIAFFIQDCEIFDVPK